MTIDKQALREELSNPAIGSKDHLRKLALSLLDELDVKEEQRANWFQMAQKLGEDFDAAEKRIAEQREYYEGVIADGSKRIAELERSETQLINERDSAESALNDAYKAVMGQAPEWSNWFSFENAIDEIELVCELWRNQTDDVIQFRQRIQELEAKLETTDRLQDGAFRDGLKAGFSYGQTDDQSGFTQCMSAYNTTPASLLPDGLIRAVHFYEQVKRENPPVETGAWKDAIDWVLKEACLAASTLESSREHEAISQQEKA
ncbi:ead/Ea22-like family protein [Salmonella enterica]|nr:ead/Ea22-like family protein [Salmonella enterica]